MNNTLIDADRGAFYLGSTGPDMHVLSRADRMSSHYFDLDCLDEQDSVESFFCAHRDLQGRLEARRLDGRLRRRLPDAPGHRRRLDHRHLPPVLRPRLGARRRRRAPTSSTASSSTTWTSSGARTAPAMDEIRDALAPARLHVDVDFLEHGDHRPLARYRRLTWPRCRRPGTASRAHRQPLPRRRRRFDAGRDRRVHEDAAARSWKRRRRTSARSGIDDVRGEGAMRSP